MLRASFLMLPSTRSIYNPVSSDARGMLLFRVPDGDVDAITLQRHRKDVRQLRTVPEFVFFTRDLLRMLFDAWIVIEAKKDRNLRNE